MAFLLSKLLWALISPGNLLVLLLLVGLVLSNSSRAAAVKMGRVLTAFTAFCFLVLAILPVGDWALTPLENRFVFAPPDHVDGIVIIGGDEDTVVSSARGTPVALDSLRRYLMFADLVKRYPGAQLVFSGGSPHLGLRMKYLDADIARDLMSKMGVPVEHMTFEKISRNTYENAVLTAAIIRPKAQQNWLLVTSAAHMPRAIGCFRHAGWNVYAAPASYFTTGQYQLELTLQLSEQLHMLTMATHEYVGLVSYWMMGRTSALWPG